MTSAACSVFTGARRSGDALKVCIRDSQWWAFTSSSHCGYRVLLLKACCCCIDVVQLMLSSVLVGCCWCEVPWGMRGAWGQDPTVRFLGLHSASLPLHFVLRILCGCISLMLSVGLLKLIIWKKGVSGFSKEDWFWVSARNRFKRMREQKMF